MPSLNPQILKPVTTPEHIASIDTSLSWAVRYQIDVKRRKPDLTLFKLANWVAVPVIDRILTDSQNRARLRDALLSNGYQVLYGVLLEHLLLPVRIYEVPINDNGLEEFHWAIGTFLSILFEGKLEPEWILISLESEYYIIAGPPELICCLLGCDVEEAFLKFHDYIQRISNAEPVSDEVKWRLSCFYNQLKQYTTAEIGTEFHLI